MVDSSALLAILESEPEHLAFVEVISKADRRLVSAVSYQETGQVAFARRGSGGVQELDALLSAMQAEIVAHDVELARHAVEAFRKFGKGIHSKARLNMGDCAVYALSKQSGAPLLFKGGDFAATDIDACLPAADHIRRNPDAG